MHFRSTLILSCAATFAVATSGFAAQTVAAEPAVVSGSGVTITSTDLNAEAQRIPLEARKAALGRAETVGQLASNLYVRRALANEAEAVGLTKDPLVEAAIRAARDRVLSDAMLVRIDAANKPTDAALDQYTLSRYKADTKRFEIPAQLGTRHILIKSSSPDARATIEKIQAELKSGADFAALATKYSEDPGSAAKGGDLGMNPRGRMVAPFEEAAWALSKPGDISPIVQSEFGFHIIRLEARQEAAIRPFEEVRESLRKEVLTSLLNEARARESQRLLGAATFDRNAIEAFAAAQR